MAETCALEESVCEGGKAQGSLDICSICGKEMFESRTTFGRCILQLSIAAKLTTSNLRGLKQ